VQSHHGAGGDCWQCEGAGLLDTVDTATVYYDHPYHAPLEHSLNIDLVNAAEGAGTRVALELSADSARALVRAIHAALEQGEDAHGG